MTVSVAKRTEHEFNIDRKMDITVPLRKVGRVAAFRRGLRDRGYNLVRTVADMQTISQLLDRDRDELSETGLQVSAMEQVVLWAPIDFAVIGCKGSKNLLPITIHG